MSRSGCCYNDLVICKGSNDCLTYHQETDRFTYPCECILVIGDSKLCDADIMVLPLDVTDYKQHGEATKTVLAHFEKVTHES